MVQPTHRATSGPDLFARYAYPPNELGYCGPDDPRGLLVRGTPDAAAEIGRRARKFEGAWVYLELIARATGISDPLDARVVQAYWLGSDLLESIDSGWFLEQLRSRFHGQSGGQWTGGIPDLEARVLPHHAFHVFAIYPWVGLLNRDSDVARSILDQCRIRTGVVQAVRGSTAQVELRPLTWDGCTLQTGQPELISARWADNGTSLLDGIDVGDQVSIHWDWVCDVLVPEEALAIEGFERRQLEVTNAVLASQRG